MDQFERLDQLFGVVDFVCGSHVLFDHFCGSLFPGHSVFGRSGGGQGGIPTVVGIDAGGRFKDFGREFLMLQKIGRGILGEIGGVVWIAGPERLPAFGIVGGGGVSHKQEFLRWHNAWDERRVVRHRSSDW